jgi:DNA-binding transcriptional LysR family regulator
VLDLRQLAALRSVAENRSIAGAARTLGWSQPTIAYHLKGLGVVLGAPVVTSSASGTRLAPAGRQLLPHAEAILDRASRAVAEVTEMIATRRASVSVGIFPSAGARLLPSVVRSLWRGGYTVCVREAELDVLLDEIGAMSLDAAIIYSDHQQPTIPSTHLQTRPLFTEQFFLIVPAEHPLAGHSNVELDAFADDGWILGAAENDPCDAALLAAATQLGFTPHAAMRSDDYAVVAGYVEAGFGVALVPELALPAHMDGVSVLTLRDRSLVREIALVTSEYVDEDLARILTDAVTSSQAQGLGPHAPRIPHDSWNCLRS